MKQFSDILLSHADDLKDQNPSSSKGIVHWQSPSNIAIVKYWGKLPGQLPANASLSLTLRDSLTNMRIEYTFDPRQVRADLDFMFEGNQNQEFSRRLNTYLESIHLYMPWLANTSLSISSENTFPHSSGIASSASSMSALALGLCEIENKIFNTETEIAAKLKASFLARLGSGSASRSIYENMALWGKTEAWQDSSNEYAVALGEVHEEFETIHDSILIIDSGKKEISSSAGHEMMHTNPYANIRFKSADQNLTRLIQVLRTGDWQEFIRIMENEALSLHAMMMTNNPGFILMKENTLIAINRIREFRRESGCSVGFTLDAGANVHIVYRDKDAKSVLAFIENELRNLGEDKMIIYDQIGNGPKRINA